MQMYNCQVRLGGLTTSEVPKDGVTAAEIVVLRHIHGSDAVVRIVPKNKGIASNSMERTRLRSLYEVSDRQAGLIDSIFGVAAALPQEIDIDAFSDGAVQPEGAAAEIDPEAEFNLRVEAEVARRVESALDGACGKTLEPTKPRLDGTLTAEGIKERDAKREAAFRGKYPKKGDQATAGA